MHEFLISTVAFIVLLGIMVVVHEFGHFAVAKLCGIRVEAFSVGFGPRLFGVKYGDTDYKICLLPLGGFVKMTGENPSEEPNFKDDPAAFTSHPRWQRMLVGVAGPAANFLLAFLAMTFYFNWINEVPAVEVKTTTIEWVTPGSAAAQAGLEPGDVIRHFETVDQPTWQQVSVQAALNQNQTVPITVERSGKILQLSMHVPTPPRSGDFDIDDTGMLEQRLTGPIGVKSVIPGAPAAKAGLRAGDAIQSVDGHAFHSVDSLLYYMQSGRGVPITLVVIRNGATLPPIVARPAILESGNSEFPWKLGFTPADFPISRQPLPLAASMSKSVKFCAENSLVIVKVLKGIFTRRVAVSQLSGPVGIARMAGEAAEMRGWFPKFTLGAAISLNLGILNLLPFPILDGGLILFLFIESVMRRDVNLLVKEYIYQAALVVLLLLTAYILFNDVTKLPIFTRLKP
jgi:regulator of sigma E protease